MGNNLKNIKLVIQYEATKYQGWQRQESTGNTIQSKLESIFKKMTGEEVEINGSGRTDSGVHAYGQVANVMLATDLSAKEIMEYANQYLPEDIAIIKATEVNERFHARLNAKGKKYVYRVKNTSIPNVFERRYTYEFPLSLNLDEMQKAANMLVGTHDFKAFCSKNKVKKSTIRTIESIKIERVADEVRFTYTGNGFLYHMVRIITGTLLEIGSGQRKADEITEILEKGLRENAGPLVPGKGLTLLEVFY